MSGCASISLSVIDRRFVGDNSMKKLILAVVLVLVIGAAGAEVAYVAWQQFNSPVREEMKDKIVFKGKLLRKWTDELSSDDVTVRREAAEALTAIPAEDGQYAMGALFRAVKDQDNLTRIRAGAALAHLTSEVRIPAPVGTIVCPPLIEVLLDADPNVRREGANVLAKFGPMVGPAVPALTELAKNDKDEEVRKAAVSALEKIQPPEKAPAADHERQRSNDKGTDAKSAEKKATEKKATNAEAPDGSAPP